MTHDVYTVPIRTEPAYDVLVGHGLLEECGMRIRAVASDCRVMIVSDDAVYALYGEKVTRSLEDAGFRTDAYVFPHGEASKSVERLIDLINTLAESGLTRTDLVLALGGGVTGDLAGLAASLYLRGVRLIQIPTTLLAAVDSSVGGKTAVNLPSGKNLCGSFYQPSLVICDCDVFGTLADSVFSDGMAETVKYAVLKDPALFGAMEAFERGGDISGIVAACVQMKNDYIVHDVQDHGERQFLNLGHTPAHAIEKTSGFTVSHGHAVAAGMMIMARAAEKMGISEERFSERLGALLARWDLPLDAPYSAQVLAQAAGADKKRRGSSITLVMPLAIGHCVLYPVQIGQLESVFEAGTR